MRSPEVHIPSQWQAVRERRQLRGGTAPACKGD